VNVKSAPSQPRPIPGGGHAPATSAVCQGKAAHLKVIACEIAFREICHAAARAKHMLDLEFLTQGHHENPEAGRADIQQRIDAVPAGKYDAILLGYGLCSNMLVGLESAHTPLVVPHAHDCITFFLGSKDRYQEMFSSHPGTYYYTSGWLECPLRRGKGMNEAFQGFLPVPSSAGLQSAYDKWAEKYGEEQARYLLKETSRWTDAYSHGVLINFDFAQDLNLPEQVKGICAQRGWQYEEVQGDLGLLQRWLDGQWDPEDFLIVRPSESIVATYDEKIIGVKPASG
jgi:hypothetical protein